MLPVKTRVNCNKTVLALQKRVSQFCNKSKPPPSEGGQQTRYRVATTMKSQDSNKPKRLSKQGAAHLAARASEAEKQADTARNIARLAKTRFKDARKAHKAAKKFARQARKEAKAAAKAWKAKLKGSKKTTRKPRSRPSTVSTSASVNGRKSKSVRALKLPVPQITPAETAGPDLKAQSWYASLSAVVRRDLAPSGQRACPAFRWQICKAGADWKMGICRGNTGKHSNGISRHQPFPGRQGLWAH